MTAASILARLQALYSDEFALSLIEVYGPQWPARERRKPGKSPLRAGWINVPAQRKAAGCDVQELLRGLAEFLESGKRLDAMNAPRVKRPGNLGLVVPRELLVLDFDSAEAFKRVREICPNHPAQSSAKGGHIVTRLPEGVAFKNVCGVELEHGLICDLRGHGAQIVVEPSIHATGVAYKWLVPLPKSPAEVPACPTQWLAAIEPHKQGLHASRTSSSVVQEFQDVHAVKAVQAVQDRQGEVRARRDENTESEISAAIEATTPKHPGLRHRAAFELARRLQAIPDMKILGDLDILELHPIVKRHYEAIPAGLKHDSLAEHWSEFVAAWDRIRHPYGHAFAAAVVEARDNPSPLALAACRQTGLDAPLMQLLAALCYQLAESWKGQAFYLSGNKAAEVLDCNDKQAWRYLINFCRVGILELVAKGDAWKGGDASLFRWVWNPARRGV